MSAGRQHTRWTAPRAGGLLSLNRPGHARSGMPPSRDRRPPLTAPTTHAAAPEPATLDAARRLHAYLGARHVHDGRLSGADQGVRWNIRVGRFVKSYLPFLKPRERYYFLQGQAYWAFASWTLGDLTRDPAFHATARAATRVIAATQRPDGPWDYP